MNHPKCGNCGYDLTGAEGNRCPECGLLFVEAGVLLRRGATGRRRRTRWIVTFVVAIVGVGGGGATLAYLRAEAARAQAQQNAAMARAQAAAARQQAAAAKTAALIERLRQTRTEIDALKGAIDVEKSGKDEPFSLIPSASADIQKTERPRADERATLTAPAWLKWYIEALKESHSASETQTAGATTEQESINEEPTLMRNVHLAPADDAVMAAYLYIVEHRREDRRDNWTQFDGAVRESDYSRRVRDFELSINELLDVLDSSD